MSEFARKQLEKYGWTKGKGLGKDENGITNPIKPKLKFDNHGIGHDNVKNLTSAWWLDLFNDASKRIQVQNNKSGVQFSNKKRKEATLSSTALIHKSFVKAEVPVHSSELPQKSTSVISDSIFQNSEGTKKSCFNYSLMKGKIKRINKQDALFEQRRLRKELKSKKKKKKKKHTEENFVESNVNV